MITIRRLFPPILAVLTALALAGCGGGGDTPPPDPSGDYIIIDHNCVDLSAIPSEWITAVKAMKIHYAHTSHGGQITEGLDQLMAGESPYDYAIEVGSLPTTAGVLCIFEHQRIGETVDDYVEPQDYWQEQTGIDITCVVLDDNPSISLSMWAWCAQCDHYSEEEMQEYLDQMAAFETQYSGEVRFVYFTGNCDSNSEAGYIRHRNNEMIRAWVRQGYNRILFDFGDLECWLYDGEGSAYDHSTNSYNPGSGAVTVPVRHANYADAGVAHTNLLNCTNKAKAYWWMLARIAGWSGE